MRAEVEVCPVRQITTRRMPRQCGFRPRSELKIIAAILQQPGNREALYRFV